MTNSWFVSPVKDPWFQALVPTIEAEQNTDGSWTNVTYYESESPVSVLGCACQYQVSSSYDIVFDAGLRSTFRESLIVSNGPGENVTKTISKLPIKSAWLITRVE